MSSVRTCHTLADVVTHLTTLLYPFCYCHTFHEAQAFPYDLLDPIKFQGKLSEAAGWISDIMSEDVCRRGVYVLLGEKQFKTAIF